MRRLKESELDNLCRDLHLLDRWKIVGDQFEYINHHNNVVEHALTSESKKLDENFSDDMNLAKDSEEEDEILAYYGAEFHEKEHMYPSFHRASIILTLYSFFETTLSYYCDGLKEKFLPQGGKPLRGSILKQRAWLENKVDVDFSHCSTQWDEINNIRILRNMIVHNFGDIYSNEKIHPYIENCQFLDFSESGIGYCHGADGGIEIKPGYFSHVAQTMKCFFEALTLGFSPLFDHSVKEINDMIDEHFKIEEDIKRKYLESLGEKVTLKDILENIY